MSEDTLDDWDYHEETVIGHHVAARIDDDTGWSKTLNEIRDDLDLPRKPPMVKIEVGDLAWDETKTVRIRVDTLAEMADVLRYEHESE
jgi:hypothetical protein